MNYCAYYSLHLRAKSGVNTTEVSSCISDEEEAEARVLGAWDSQKEHTAVYTHTAQLCCVVPAPSRARQKGKQFKLPQAKNKKMDGTN